MNYKALYFSLLSPLMSLILLLAHRVVVYMLNLVQLFRDPVDRGPWNPHRFPLFMGFLRQEYWNALLFPSPGDLPNPGSEFVSPALQADSLPLSHLGSP